MPLSYAQVPLDRASAERKNPDWIAQQLSAPGTRFLCLHSQRNLMRRADGGMHPVFIEQDNASALFALARKPVFLGMRDDCACFALDVSQQNECAISTPDGSAFVDLRKVATLIDTEHAALLAYARGLIYWHAHNQYCANCGSLNYAENGGHSRHCSNPKCGRDVFPRTDPAVIMLVEHCGNDGVHRCLLGRNKRFADRMFSTLAGFVDPGETLEETVAREVYEEAGIHVSNVRYQASQPWPFPSSIMLGFRATADTIDINIDAEEIEEAYWFSAEEVRTFGEWGDGGSNNCLPRRDSIARHLIDSWVTDTLG